ncbi:DNA repair protein RecN, partial [uncultured Schumannella sp.]|uniref:DNA repair protein RecN n=1 Tax=uncultured Schumannella sp. TaxID=1195956 RepID=UPI0025D2227F
AVVGGRSAPVGVLNEIGQQLVVVHGQSDQIRLRSAVAQREALDRFAGPGFSAVLADYQDVFRRWQTAQSELDVLVAERDRREREAEELRNAMDEIEAAAPRRGEDAELAERAERLSNLEDLRLAAVEAQEAISAQLSDDARDATVLVESARRSLERVAGHDAELAPVIESLAAARFALEDSSAKISSYLGALDTDGGRELETIQERRAALAALARRFGPSIDEMIDFYESGSTRLLELDGDSDRIDSLRAAVAQDFARVEQLADQLSVRRREAAERLSAAVTHELAALAMPDARLSIEVAPRELGLTGRDQVAIRLQPHSGAEPRPLSRGASGGELSRVMLAIEVVLAGSDPVPTFVFDEVDAGVGGASAIEVGRRLAKLAETAQVIVVTHLAQVAAFATNHLTVVKGSDGSITASSVHRLEGEERAAEMARLLSGLPDSETGLEHARELLGMARAS